MMSKNKWFHAYGGKFHTEQKSSLSFQSTFLAIIFRKKRFLVFSSGHHLSGLKRVQSYKVVNAKIINNASSNMLFN
jgi:hypothetical protein